MILSEIKSKLFDWKFIVGILISIFFIYILANEFNYSSFISILIEINFSYFFTAILISNDWQAFQTDAVFMAYSEPSFTWDAFATLLVIQPLMILLFSKMYKWKKWKESLF